VIFLRIVLNTEFVIGGWRFVFLDIPVRDGGGAASEIGFQ
jgi:hypothetical protein